MPLKEPPPPAPLGAVRSAVPAPDAASRPFHIRLRTFPPNSGMAECSSVEDGPREYCALGAPGSKGASGGSMRARRQCNPSGGPVFSYYLASRDRNWKLERRLAELEALREYDEAKRAAFRSRQGTVPSHCESDTASRTSTDDGRGGSDSSLDRFIALARHAHAIRGMEASCSDRSTPSSSQWAPQPTSPGLCDGDGGTLPSQGNAVAEPKFPDSAVRSASAPLQREAAAGGLSNLSNSSGSCSCSCSCSCSSCVVVSSRDTTACSCCEMSQTTLRQNKRRNLPSFATAAVLPDLLHIPVPRRLEESTSGPPQRIETPAPPLRAQEPVQVPKKSDPMHAPQDEAPKTSALCSSCAKVILTNDAGTVQKAVHSGADVESADGSVEVAVVVAACSPVTVGSPSPLETRPSMPAPPHEQPDDVVESESRSASLGCRAAPLDAGEGVNVESLEVPQLPVVCPEAGPATETVGVNTDYTYGPSYLVEQSVGTLLVGAEVTTIAELGALQAINSELTAQLAAAHDQRITASVDSMSWKLVQLVAWESREREHGIQAAYETILEILSDGERMERKVLMELTGKLADEKRALHSFQVAVEQQRLWEETLALCVVDEEERGRSGVASDEAVGRAELHSLVRRDAYVILHDKCIVQLEEALHRNQAESNAEREKLLSLLKESQSREAALRVQLLHSLRSPTVLVESPFAGELVRDPLGTIGETYGYAIVREAPPAERSMTVDDYLRTLTKEASSGRSNELLRLYSKDLPVHVRFLRAHSAAVDAVQRQRELPPTQPR